MFRDKLFYYLANYTLQHTFEKEVVKFINHKRITTYEENFYMVEHSNVSSFPSVVKNTTINYREFAKKRCEL